MNKQFKVQIETNSNIAYLKKDGKLETKFDLTYACALRGIPVPCPTPQDNFTPSFVRRRFEREYPRLVGSGRGHRMNNGYW